MPKGRIFGRLPHFEIIASIGPSSLNRIADLHEAGVDVFRVNASHLPGKALAATLTRVLAVVPADQVIVDLQGAKMRFGDSKPRRIVAGKRLKFALAARRGEISLPHPELYDQLKPGETLTADDGRLRFEVLTVAPERIEVRALDSGALMPRKGVNLTDHPIRMAGLSQPDGAIVELCSERGISRFAFSFMCYGREAAWLRSVAPNCTVIGKIERAEAVTALHQITDRVDMVWICRGDLQAQIGPAAMAAFVNGLSPTLVKRPLFMAGQVMDHLTSHSGPTRSEVCHLYDLMARGYAGIVLSDETAIGVNPVRAAATTLRLVNDFKDVLRRTVARR